MPSVGFKQPALAAERFVQWCAGKGCLKRDLDIVPFQPFGEIVDSIEDVGGLLFDRAPVLCLVVVW